MYEVIFDQVSNQNNGLELQGERAQGRITLLENGVWRILVASNWSEKDKASWVLPPMTSQPFQIKAVAGTLLLDTGDGMNRLQVNLDPFTWCWRSFETCRMEMKTQGSRLAPKGLQLTYIENENRHYYGLGERTGYLDKRGRVWTNWTTDEPHHQALTDELYQAHPFFLAFEDDQAFGVYLDESWRTRFDLAATQARRSKIESAGPTFDLYLIPGPKPKDVIERFSALVGRASLPPIWALGYQQCRWSYPNDKTLRALAREFRERELPCDVLWMDIDYMEGYKSFTVSEQRFPDLAKLTKDLQADGFKVVTIIDPGIKKEKGYEVYESGLANDVFVKTERGDELVGEVWPKRAVWPDFSRPEVRRWWGQWYKGLIDNGVAGFWNDMNEPAVFSVEGEESKRHFPEEARHGAHSHAEIHNVYGSLMARATSEGVQKLRPDQRPFVLSRSGFSGIQQHAWVWTGDNASTWNHLEMSIPMLLNLGISGVPFIGADIGGFFQDCNGELLARWTWLGVFYPFMRNHCGRSYTGQEPWVFGEPWTSAVTAAIRFRYVLMPYIYTLSKRATENGLPLMRSMFMSFPEDDACLSLFDQFTFGDDLLVAPIVRPAIKRRLLYAPAGGWQDFFTGACSNDDAGWHIVGADFDALPLWQRQGSAIPLTNPRLFLDTAIWATLRWRVVLGEEIFGEVYEDTGDGYVNGFWSQIHGTFDGQRLQLTFKDLTGLDRHCGVEILGVAKPSKCSCPFTWDDNTLTLTMDSANLEVEW